MAIELYPCGVMELIALVRGQIITKDEAREALGLGSQKLPLQYQQLSQAIGAGVQAAEQQYAGAALNSDRSK